MQVGVLMGLTSLPSNKLLKVIQPKFPELHLFARYADPLGQSLGWGQ